MKPLSVWNCLSVPRVLLGLVALVALVGLSHCGPKPNANPPRRTADTNEASTPRDTTHRPPPRRDDGIAIQGLKGTIDEAAVHKALNAKISQVSACRSNHIGSFNYVGGSIRLFFKIGLDGAPIKVVIEKSQLGHHALETCILAVAKSLRFAKPEGGVAEVRYTMQIANNGTDAKEWEEDQPKAALRRKRRALAACRRRGKPRKFTLTFYVLPGGKATTVGVASPEDIPAGFGACVSKVIQATTFPDPLGEVARATYEY